MNTVFLDAGGTVDVPTVVCLGFFDGVHLGHVSLVRRAQQVAPRGELAVCVHTFDAMPARVLQPEADILELTPLAEKAALLDALGVDILAVSHFDAGTSQMRAQAFFDHTLLLQLHARHIVAGFHHRFGYRGEADAQALEAFCAQAGIGLDIIAPVTLDSGELISSTAIRAAIRAGDTQKASRMLGRSWRD